MPVRIPCLHVRQNNRIMTLAQGQIQTLPDDPAVPEHKGDEWQSIA